jgi:hypothetical protein
VEESAHVEAQSFVVAIEREPAASIVAHYCLPVISPDSLNTITEPPRDSSSRK